MIKNLDSLLTHGDVELRKPLLSIISQLLEEIRADNIIRENVHVDEKLKIGEFYFPFDFEDIYVVGFGKASGEMALALEDIMGDRISGGIINTNHSVNTKRVKINITSHPLPDENTVEKSTEIVEFLKGLDENSLVIFLVSGGASSLFEIPANGFTVGDVRKKVERMMKEGKRIEEINRERIKMSAVKGGKLLNYFRGNCISLILSDVLSSPELVGSGPTYGARCKNIVIADNNYAKKKAWEIAKRMGLNASISNTTLMGEPSEISDRIYRELSGIKIWGGETTVKIEGKRGVGGRNQELSLYLGEKIKGKRMAFACIGTDGIDGNSPAAGGIVDGYTAKKYDVKKWLKEHNSYALLSLLNDAIITGHTGTNLADICVGISLLD